MCRKDKISTAFIMEQIKACMTQAVILYHIFTCFSVKYTSLGQLIVINIRTCVSRFCECLQLLISWWSRSSTESQNLWGSPSSGPWSPNFHKSRESWVTLSCIHTGSDLWWCGYHRKWMMFGSFNESKVKWAGPTTNHLKEYFWNKSAVLIDRGLDSGFGCICPVYGNHPIEEWMCVLIISFGNSERRDTSMSTGAQTSNFNSQLH